jgi:hypothetical protein
MFKVTYDTPNTMNDEDVDKFWGEAKPDTRRWNNEPLMYPRQYWYLIMLEDLSTSLRLGVSHRVMKKGETQSTTYKHEWPIGEVELHVDDQGIDYAKVFVFFFLKF